ncbi:hypothetical protein B0H13DRAFT_1930454 [Mycena leptocephala]|nr:hypothetical protein B0H13DRAFT_1930454 [Mycena leptocephala]
MPPGRPKLNPEVKQQHVEDARKRYEEKNIEKRRAAARLRMQHKREDIAASGFLTRRKYAVKAAATSEMYRARKQQEQRAQMRVADNVKKEARRREHEELRKKHRPPATRPSSKAPTKLSRTVRKPRAASPTMPTPAPRRPAARALAAAAHDDASDQDLDDEGPALPHEAPPWPDRAPHSQRCPYCYAEDCVGCACMCESSRSWIQHDATLSYSIYYIQKFAGITRDIVILHSCHVLPLHPNLPPGSWPRGSNEPPGAAVSLLGLLAIASSRNIPTPLHGRRQPGPTSITCGHSSARSTTTTRRHRCRKALCLSHRNPPPPSSPSDLTASTPPRMPSPVAASTSIKKPNQERADNIARTLPEGVGRGVVPHLASPRPLPVPMTPRRVEPKAAGPPNPRLLREELDFLAATRPPPVPISPERLRQQFVRVLGAEAARLPAAKASGASSPKKTRASEATGVKAREPPQYYLLLSFPYPGHLAGVQVVDAGESAGDPLMYAVSGQNRIFHDRNRALAAFKSKPGADLIFSRDEDEVFGFLAEDVDSKEVEGKVNAK